jgi:hypothetical protein
VGLRIALLGFLAACGGAPGDLLPTADLAGVSQVSGDLGANPDLTSTDLASTDLASADLASADPALPDMALSDLASANLASPDLASLDLASPDLATFDPDLAKPDLAKPDLAKPDLASPDLASPDLATPPDLSPARDLSPPRDLATSHHVRVAIGNLTAGNDQSYTTGEGIRILSGLTPDIVLLQELNYGTNSDAEILSMAQAIVGPEVAWFRESGMSIPNGIFSRYPIIAAGSWQDALTNGTRGFAWAHLDVPGERDLWAVSVHLLTTSSTLRDQEAQALVALINANIPASDYVVLGGDFNTRSRGDLPLTTLSSLFTVTAPWPVDEAGNDNTSGPRTRPHDWLLSDAELGPLQVDTIIGPLHFAAGLVFDTRVFSRLDLVPPALAGDSAAVEMQHMAVVKDFELSAP